MHLQMPHALVVCCIYVLILLVKRQQSVITAQMLIMSPITHASKEATSVDPDQIAWNTVWSRGL